MTSDDQKQHPDVPRYTLEQMQAIYGNLSRSYPVLASVVDGVARSKKPPCRDVARFYGYSQQDAGISLTYARYLTCNPRAWCIRLRHHLAARLLP